jgi:hypothetical protein
MALLLIVSVILFPLTYALKLVYDLETTWIDPAYLTGLLALLLYLVKVRGRPRLTRSEWGMVGVLSAFVAFYCVVGLLSLVRYLGGDGPILPTAYACIRDPMRLTLSAALFGVVVLAVRDKVVYTQVLKAFVWVGIAQFAAAAYMVAAVAWSLYLPPGWLHYVEVYYWRQALYHGALVFPRLGGTFYEAPTYGLFLLCAVASNVLLLKYARGWTYRITLVVLGIGTVASLSDQVLLGFAVLPIVIFLRRAPYYVRRRPAATLAGAMIAVVTMSYFAFSMQRKAAVEAQMHLARGHSVSERVYHTKHGLDLLESQPLTGVGPGLYGHYAEKTGIWPHTVTVQAMAPEILVGDGSHRTGLGGSLHGRSLYVDVAAE